MATVVPQRSCEKSSKNPDYKLVGWTNRPEKRPKTGQKRLPRRRLRGMESGSVQQWADTGLVFGAQMVSDMTIVKFLHGAVRTLSTAARSGSRPADAAVGTSAEARPYRLAVGSPTSTDSQRLSGLLRNGAGAYQPAAGIDVGNVQEFSVDLTPGTKLLFCGSRVHGSSALGPASAELMFTVPWDARSASILRRLPAGATITRDHRQTDQVTGWIGWASSRRALQHHR